MPGASPGGKLQENAAGLLLAKESLEQETAPEERLDPALFQLDNTLFWWYFLRVAFIRSMDELDTSGLALEDLTRGLPDVRWERRLLGCPANGSQPTLGRLLSFPVGEHWLHIRFHLSYIQYYWDSQPVWKPIFQWEQVARLPKGPVFWLLLPLTKADVSQRPHVMQELETRIGDFSLPGCDPERAVHLLTGYLAPPAGELQVLRMERQEIGGTQYSFQVYKDGTLRCYSQRDRGQCRYAEYATIDEAAEQGAAWMTSIRELYQQTPLLPKTHLPDALRVQWYCAPPVNLEGPEQITPPEVARWMDAFLTQDLTEPTHIVRLELSWGDRQAAPNSRTAASSLVLLESGGSCLALYFQGAGYLAVYGAIGQPELYRPGGNHPMSTFQGRPIPEYFIHPDRVRLTSQMHALLRQIGETGTVGSLIDSRQWSFLSVRTGDALVYSRAKREFGGFEDVAAQNPLNGKLELPYRPDWLYTVRQTGETALDKGAEVFREKLELALAALFDGQLTMLQMGWKTAKGLRCSILFLRQEQQYLMLYRNHEKNSGEFLVGDRKGYLNAEKKIRRVSFCGHKMEFYLLHDAPQTIRNGLDLLLPNIFQPGVATQNFGEWAFRSGADLAALPTSWQPPEGV